MPETATLAKQRTIPQAPMRFRDHHLHEYEIARRRDGLPDPDWGSTEPVIKWLGYPFDPSVFDLAASNRRLARIEA